MRSIEAVETAFTLLSLRTGLKTGANHLGSCRASFDRLRSLK